MEKTSELALLRLARETIERAANESGKDRDHDRSPLPEDPEFRSLRGAFVSLHTKDGAVRGCVGTTSAVRPLVDVIIDMARAAAMRDPRFTPVRRDELEDISVEISILHPPERITSLAEVEIGRDGLLVVGRGRRGLLLPQVAEERDWDPITFARHTCRKAGLDDDAFHDPEVELFRFTAEVFSEPHAQPIVVA